MLTKPQFESLKDLEAHSCCVRGNTASSGHDVTHRGGNGYIIGGVSPLPFWV